MRDGVKGSNAVGAALVGLAALTLLVAAGGVGYVVWADQSRRRAEAAEQADRRRAAEIPDEIARLERRQLEAVGDADADDQVWESRGVKALQAEAGVLMREFDAIADRRPEWGLRRYYRKR